MSQLMRLSWTWMPLVASVALAGCGDKTSKSTPSPNSTNAASNNVVTDCSGASCELLTLPSEALYGTWGTSRDNWWAVGIDGVVVHGSGTTFEVLESPTTVALRAVAGAAPDDVWIAGDAGTILHWDGNRLADVSPDLPEVQYEAIGFFGGRTYAIADGRVDRQTSDLLGWETALEHKDVSPGSLVDCAGAAWITGSGNVFRSVDGDRWQGIGLNHASHDVQDALVLGPDDVFVAFSTLLRWDGAVWTHEIGGAGPGIIELESDHAGGVWALRTDGILMQGDGVTWTDVDDLNFEIENLHDLIQNADRWMWSERQDELWFVNTGIGGTRRWTRDEGKRSVGFSNVTEPGDVHWNSATDVWAVSSDTALEHYDGERWAEVIELPGAGAAVWASGPNDVWIGGREGWVAHWNGSELTEHTPPIPADREESAWNAVFGVDGDIWFAGPDLVRYRAGQWEAFTDAGFTRASTQTMFAGTASDLWLFTNRRISHWDGAQWSDVDVDRGVHEASCVDDELWSVQAEGAGLYRTTNGDWTEVIETTRSLGGTHSWIGSPSFGYNLQQVKQIGTRRIAQFDGRRWTVIVDDTGTLSDVWGWNDPAGGIVVGAAGAVYLLGQ